jgi:predicted Zn-dependent protease
MIRLFRWVSAHFATPRLLIEIAAVAVALYGVDQFLASLETRELTTEARHDFNRGELLLQQGRAPEAIEQFRHAHVEDRDNRTFALGLADAYLVDRQPERAQSGLEELLATDSNDAEANLRMARVMSEEDDATRADSYYHRAIYGVWHANQSAELARDRTAARMELVAWLADRHQNRELLSELLLLDQSARTDSAVAAKLPALYAEAGDLNRAEAAYRTLIHSNPSDPAVYAGLGDIELDRGNFHGAREAFEHARRLDPDNGGFQQKAQIAGRALDLDPTSRHLTSSDKLARSTAILTIAVDAAQKCSAVEPEVVQAAAALLHSRATSESSDASETRLQSAEDIWHELPPSCASPEDAAVLAAVMRKVDQ